MADAHPHVAAINALRNRAVRPLRALCYAPFTQLSFDPSGAVSVCCLSRAKPIGDVCTQSLREIWHSAAAAAYRERLGADEWPEGCNMCRWELEGGNVQRHPLLDFDEVPIAPDGAWPTRLEFALSNQCNLACIHCRPGLSSTIEKQRGLPPSPRLYGERFFAELAEFLPHATDLSFLGGEPFLQDECHRIWEMLIAAGLRPAVFVTTNGTVWNHRVEQVLERLPMRIAVSIDGATPRTIRAVRTFAQPEALWRNVQRFRDAALRREGGVVTEQGFLMQLNFCLMRRNWKEMGDFFLRAEELACRIWATPVAWPPARSLFTLPAHALRRVRDVLQRHSQRVLPQLSRNADSWRGVLAVVDAEADRADEREANQPMLDAWDAQQRGDPEAAWHAAARTPTKSPLYLKSLLLRASLALTHGRYDVAAQLIADAERIDGAAPELLLQRGWLGLCQGHIADALADAEALAAAVAANTVEPWLAQAGAELLAKVRERVAERPECT